MNDARMVAGEEAIDAVYVCSFFDSTVSLLLFIYFFIQLITYSCILSSRLCRVSRVREPVSASTAALRQARALARCFAGHGAESRCGG